MKLRWKNKSIQPQAQWIMRAHTLKIKTMKPAYSKFADKAVQNPVAVRNERCLPQNQKDYKARLIGTTHNQLWLCFEFQGFVIDCLVFFKAVHSNIKSKCHTAKSNIPCS